MNGIDSLISLSDFSLLVYRSASDFCVLTLYPTTLLNSLIISRNFLIVSFGFSMYIIMSSANNESFTYFSIQIPFISSYSLISIARTFKTMLNNCGENGHPCLVPELRGNALSFSNIENNVCCGLFIYGRFPLCPFFEAFFIINGCWFFFKGFFCIYWDDCMVFMFQFVSMVHHTDCCICWRIIASLE